tara:strand:+ start:101 stop:394 length:294 start_codon:yes stop_codon:yes gene_type:complete
MHVPRVLVTDQLRSYGAVFRDLCPGVADRSHEGLNKRAEASHRPSRRREKIMGRFKSPRQAQRFMSLQDQTTAEFLQYPTATPALTRSDCGAIIPKK